MRRYTVITGDLVKSREIPMRRKVQIRLWKTLDKINQQFKKYIVVKFSITLGDEFQGLIHSTEKSYLIIKEIQKSMYPVEISFGVGVGSISTKIAKKTTEMDGECFRYSREALEKAKELKQSIVYNTRNVEKDMAINTIIMLIDAIKKKWKKKHYQRINLYEQLGTLEKVAKAEKVTKQMISKMFIGIKYEKVKKAEKSIENLLSTL